jgi:hypothetical protein
LDQSSIIFHLKASPSGPFVMNSGEAATTSWRFSSAGHGYKLDIVRRLGRRRKARKVIIEKSKAKQWLELIGRVQVSMFPDEQDSCDGNFYELRTTGPGSAVVSLGWYNVAPKGAEPLDKLIDRLWGFVTPDLDFSVEQIDPNPS